jgi:hypothetical protein
VWHKLATSSDRGEGALSVVIGLGILFCVPVLLTTGAWLCWWKYDRSKLIGLQKSFALAGLWTASANVVLFLVIAFYPHEMDANSLGQVVVVGWLLSIATIILFGAGHGKGRWLALLAALILIGAWRTLYMFLNS